jgi:hypothetical protein
MQYITTKDFAVAISLINREIEQMEYYSEHPPVFEKEFTEQEIKERKENLKENRWYQDLLEARKNFNLKVHFDIMESEVIK